MLFQKKFLLIITFVTSTDPVIIVVQIWGGKVVFIALNNHYTLMSRVVLCVKNHMCQILGIANISKVDICKFKHVLYLLKY